MSAKIVALDCGKYKTASSKGKNLNTVHQLFTRNRHTRYKITDLVSCLHWSRVYQITWSSSVARQNW